MISTGLTLPRFIERAKAQTLALDLEQHGGLVTPASGTITITDDSGTEIVSSVSVTLTDDRITYPLLAATVPVTLSLSERWQTVWLITVGTTVHRIQESTHLVRQIVYPVIADSHLLTRHSDLTELQGEDEASWQPQRDEAFDDIQVWLLGQGKRAYLILSPWSLKEWHLALSLARIFRGLSTGIGKYKDLADYYDAAAIAARDSLKLEYDYDESGDVSDDTETGVAGQSVVYLSATPPWGGR